MRRRRKTVVIALNSMEMKETSQLMRTQSNRSTQYPLFIIQELQEVVKAEGCGSESKYVDWGGENELTSEQYTALEELQDSDKEDELEEDAVTLMEELSIDDAHDIDLSEFREITYDEEWVYRDDAGVFFTEHACDLHMIQNAHHYNKPRSYVISAWRNYELQETMLMILKLTEGDIPSCYQ